MNILNWFKPKEAVYKNLVKSALEVKAEVVLPDGKFLTIYKQKYGHLAAAYHTNPLLLSANLIMLTTRIDNEDITMEQILSMPPEYVALIIEKINNETKLIRGFTYRYSLKLSR